MWGSSASAILIAKNRLPEAPLDEVNRAPQPSIRSIVPEKAGIGALLEIEGIHFGSGGPGSELRFPRATPEAYIAVGSDSGLFEQWDDKKILVRVPEGVGSGFVTVHTPQGDSNTIPFYRDSRGGAKKLYDPVVYSLTFSVRLSRLAKKDGSRLTLYFPVPRDSEAQQSGEVVEESPSARIESIDGAIAYVLEDFPESMSLVARTMLVAVHEVETELDGYRENFPSGEGIPNYLRSWLEADPLVPSGAPEVIALATKTSGKERNPQKRAIALWSWMKKNISWRPGSQAARTSPAAAIKAGKADSRQYALLAAALFRAANIPAVPIAGLLVGEGGTSIPHFWLEYYLPTVGWIPFDPVLATGAGIPGFVGGFSDKNLYFGALDNKHVAISRGYIDLLSLEPGQKAQVFKAPWSFQDVFEEYRNLGYDSEWETPRITVAY